MEAVGEAAEEAEGEGADGADVPMAVVVGQSEAEEAVAEEEASVAEAGGETPGVEGRAPDGLGMGAVGVGAAAAAGAAPLVPAAAAQVAARASATGALPFGDTGPKAELVMALVREPGLGQSISAAERVSVAMELPVRLIR